MVVCDACGSADSVIPVIIGPFIDGKMDDGQNDSRVIDMCFKCLTSVQKNATWHRDICRDNIAATKPQPAKTPSLYSLVTKPAEVP